MDSLLRFIETPARRKKVVDALHAYVPVIGGLVAVLLLVDKFLGPLHFR